MPKIKIQLPGRGARAGKSVKGSAKRPMKGTKKALPPSQTRRDSSSSLSSLANLSDDGGYSALEDASDSEDDDEDHVFAAEEQHIISHERHTQRAAARSSPRPRLDIQGDEAAYADDDDSGNDEDDNVQDEPASVYGADEMAEGDDASSESESWNGFSADEEQPPWPLEPYATEQHGSPVQRRVHFTGLPDSDSSSNDSDEDRGKYDDLYPDIFIPNDLLDSGFRHEIEHADDGDSDFSFMSCNNDDGEESCSDQFGEGDAPSNAIAHGMGGPGPWDIPFDDVNFGFPGFENGHNYPLASGTTTSALFPSAALEEEGDSEYDSDDESDGTDSDGGDTTEEDEFVSKAAKTNTPIRRASDSDAAQRDKSGEDESPIAKSSRSRNKPVCMINPHTRKMMIFTVRSKPRAPTMVKSTSNPPYDDWPSAPDTSPFKPGLSLPPGAISSLNIRDMGINPFWGPPLDSMGPASESSSLGDREEDDEEANLDMDAFLTFNNDTSDEEMDVGENADKGDTDGVETPSRTPANESTNGKNCFNAMLDHFSKTAGVGAFRLHQHQQKLVLNGAATQDSLAFSNSIYNGALRGMKQQTLMSGANMPLTPERRHKTSFAKSPAETAGAKRKASASATAGGPSRTHKRQRSTTDVRTTQT